MSQFDRKATKEAMQVTSLAPDIAKYADQKALSALCRLAWVQPNVNPTKKSKANGVFSAVIAMTDGVADVSVWDPEVISMWLKNVGSIVMITGMSCSRRGPKSSDFAHAPGEWCFNVNKGCYTITVMKNTDDTMIPINGTVPDEWLRPKDVAPKDVVPYSGSQRSFSGLTIPGTEGCCDAPFDITCKATGLPHQAVCTVCRMIINVKQPFCSKRTDGGKCSTRAEETSPAISPFKEFDAKMEVMGHVRQRFSVPGNEDHEGIPAPKFMKFSDADSGEVMGQARVRVREDQGCPPPKFNDADSQGTPEG